MRVDVNHKGDFNTLERYLKNAKRMKFEKILKRYAQRGVDELRLATPKDTGEAADSWYYEITQTKKGYKLSWSNSDAAGSVPLVVLLQYGHGTTGNTWVQGHDFINPALAKIMSDISADIWKEVRRG